jgi:hypothetical protein
MQASHATEAVEVTTAADQYSNYYTNLYGVLAWRPRTDFTTEDDDGRGWHLLYDSRLEGRSVLDTLQQAAEALEAIRVSARPLHVDRRWLAGLGLRSRRRELNVGGRTAKVTAEADSAWRLIWKSGLARRRSGALQPTWRDHGPAPRHRPMVVGGARGGGPGRTSR